MISVHVRPHVFYVYVDILFEGEVMTFSRMRADLDFYYSFENAEEVLEFIFANSELFKKRIKPRPPAVGFEDWFDPCVHTHDVKEFHEGQEEYDKLLQLMTRACL